MTNEHNTQVEPELLPCPFCGGTAFARSTGEWSYAECATCHASTDGYPTEYIATDRWNRRAISATQVEPNRVTDEMVNAACQAQAIEIARQDGVALTPSGFRHGANSRPEEHELMRAYVRRGLEAALSFAPVPPSAADGKVEATHLHKKRGSTYTLLGFGRMQCDWWQITGEGRRYPADMREVAIYRSVDDGSLWVRPREEFEDGRFEEIASPPARHICEEEVERLREALEELLHAVCSEAGFANAVRQVSGFAYPWPALDEAEAKARAALQRDAQRGGA